MEQNLRFGLVWGWLALLEKTFLADYVQLLRAVFLMNVRTKKLHKMKVKKKSKTNLKKIILNIK